MPVYAEEATPEYPLIEEYTVLECEVESVVERDSMFKDDDGNPKRTLMFTFKVIAGEHEGRKLFGDTPTAWYAKESCKLRQWAQPIMNREYSKGEPLDTDDLVGRRCRIAAGVRTKKSTGEKTNFVEGVLPDKSGAMAKASAAVANTYDDEPF